MKRLSLMRCVSVLLALALALFQSWTALFGMLPGVYQRAIHWGLLALLGCSWNMEADLKEHKRFLLAVDAFLALVSAISAAYICLEFQAISLRMGNLLLLDNLCAAALLVSVLGITCRLKNKTLTFLTLICILYTVFEALFIGHGLTIPRVLSFLYVGTEGIYGTALGVSTNYIYLFVMLGVFIEFSGAGSYFVQVAQRLTSRFSGGAAQTSLVAGGLMGMISGSGVANAVTVGSLAIPLMEDSGYSKVEAGAIQAISTNVAQLLPPVMGGVMFVAVDCMGKNYMQMSRAAIFPSLAYCLILGIVFWLHAKKNCIHSVVPNQQETGQSQPLWQGLLYLIPIAVMVLLMLLGSSAIKAGIYAVLSIAAIGVAAQLRRGTFHLAQLLAAFERVGRMVLSVTPTCACAGIIITVMTLTNVGPKMTDLVLQISDNHLYIGLLLMMLLTLLLGMFLPSSAVYIVLSALGVPALMGMGADIMPAHMFIIFFAVMAPFTPPVALSSAAVAALTQENFNRICLKAMSLALPLVLIPYVFICDEGLLFQGSVIQAVIPLLIAVVAGAAATVAIQGWLVVLWPMWARAAAGITSCAMVYPDRRIFLVALAAFLIVVLLTIKKRPAQKNGTAAAVTAHEKEKENVW